MPRYSFDLTDGYEMTPDPEGSEFDSHEEALTHAREVIRSFIAFGSKSDEWENWRCEISELDGDDETISEKIGQVTFERVLKEMRVQEWANCQEAEIADDGEIWISGPQRPHWLSDEKKAEFHRWLAAQEQPS